MENTAQEKTEHEVAEESKSQEEVVKETKEVSSSSSTGLEDGDFVASFRPQRDRKSTTSIYNPSAAGKEKKDFVLEKGTGCELGDYEFFTKSLEKFHGDSDVVKSLHNLLFNSVGKKLETKKHIRLFSGFCSAEVKQDKLKKLLENKKKWTVAILKDCLGLFGLEKSGTRDDLATRLMDYLNSPSVLKSAEAASSKSSKGKGSKGTKRKRKDNSSKKDKIKKAPSAYILFINSIRTKTKEDNPTADFATLAKLMAEKWNALDATAKEVWSEKSKEAQMKLDETAAAAVAGTAGGEEDEENDEEEEGEEEDGEEEGENDDVEEKEEVNVDDVNFDEDFNDGMKE